MKTIILLLFSVPCFAQSLTVLKDSSIATQKRMLGVDAVNTALVFKTDSLATALANQLTNSLASKLNSNGNGSALTGLTKTQVGLASADNTNDAAKPVSTAQQTALNLKANLASPTFTGTVSGVTASMVGLGNVDNVSDANKPVSTATQTALNLKYTIPVAGQSLGGTVTQATSKTTSVTLNKQYGQITMNGAALAAAAEVAFNLTNSFISSTDVVLVTIQSVGTAGAYFVTVGAVANGSCSITVGNVSAGSLSQAIVLNFAVIKSVTN